MTLNNFKQNILNNPKNIFNPYDQSIEGLIANHPYRKEHRRLDCFKIRVANYDTKKNDGL